MMTGEDTVTSLDEMRDRIANGVLLALSFISVPALMVSLMRIQVIGWQPVMGFHIFAVAVLIGASVVRAHLSYKVRGGIVVGIVFLLGVGGFLNFALNGAGYPALLLAAIIAAVLFGTRGGMLLLLLGIVAIALTGLAFSQQILVLGMDANAYNAQFQSWMTTLLGYTLLGGGGVATVIGLNSALIRSIHSFETHQAQLENLVAERTHALMEEIREREKAESSLRMSEDRYHRVIDTQAELITTFTPDGIFTFVNESYCRFVGKSKEDLLGRSLFEAIPEDEVDQLRLYFASFSRDRPQQTTENPIRSAAGDLRYYEWSNSASIDANGYVTEIQSVGRDITERKEVERLKSEFISLVSHELRTPLTSIMGSISLIAGGAAGAVPDKVANLLNIAKGNSERLIGIVNDILDFEKLQSGGMEFFFQKIDLFELVENSLNMNQAYAEQCNVTFVLKGSKNPVWVMVDKERLEQVLANLLSNAAKFSDQDTEVIISVEPEGKRARVEVSDTGPGIDEKFKERIFDRFSQADTGDTRAVKGTGLGLSISRAIIERHDGTIDFESRKGVGTTFRFELPLSSEREE